MAAQLSMAETVEGRMIQCIVGDIGSCVIGSRLIVQRIGYDFTGKAFCDVIVFRCICIDDQHAVSRKQTGKFAEGMADIIDILKKVKMICIHIENDADFREET